MQKHTLSCLLIPKQPLDCILLVCIQGFFWKVSKVLGIRHELGDLLPCFCSAKTVFRGRGLSSISSSSLFCESICLFLVVAFSRILVSTLAFARLKNLTRKVSFAHQQNGYGHVFRCFQDPPPAVKGFSTPMGFLCLPDPLEISVGVRKSLGCSAFW